MIKKERDRSDKSDLCLASLIHLDLTGLDFDATAFGGLGITFRFDGIKHLVLQSCGHMSQALEKLAQEGSHRTRKGRVIGALKHLQTFRLRHENGNPSFQAYLEMFLVALPPLFSLHVLLDGITDIGDLGPILKIHGRNLRHLVWDERRRRRADSNEETAMLTPSHWHLQMISSMCPKLLSLGLCLDWQLINSPVKESPNEVCMLWTRRIPNADLL